MMVRSCRRQSALVPVSGFGRDKLSSRSIRRRAAWSAGIMPQEATCKILASVLWALDLVFIICCFLNSWHHISQSRRSRWTSFFYRMQLSKLMRLLLSHKKNALQLLEPGRRDKLGRNSSSNGTEMTNYTKRGSMISSLNNLEKCLWKWMKEATDDKVSECISGYFMLQWHINPFQQFIAGV